MLHVISGPDRGLGRFVKWTPRVGRDSVLPRVGGTANDVNVLCLQELSWFFKRHRTTGLAGLAGLAGLPRWDADGLDQVVRQVGQICDGLVPDDCNPRS